MDSNSRWRVYLQSAGNIADGVPWTRRPAALFARRQCNGESLSQGEAEANLVGTFLLRNRDAKWYILKGHSFGLAGPILPLVKTRHVNPTKVPFVNGGSSRRYRSMTE